MNPARAATWHPGPEAEGVRAGEAVVLELLASDLPFHEMLHRIALAYEQMFPGMLCSVLTLDADGRHLRHGAGPSLPLAYCRAVDGIEIGPAVGSCGTAAFERRLTLVEDIENDPLWEEGRALALAHGLRACWSVPVMSPQQTVLGTFALYYGEPRAPDPEEMATLERGAHFVGLAIERHRLLRSLQESQLRLDTLVGNLPGMAYRCRNDPDWTMLYVSPGCEALTGYRADELEGNRAVTYASLIHPADRDWLWAQCQASLDAHTPCRNEYRVLDKNSRERWVAEWASGVYDGDGGLLFIDGFIQDITVSRAAELGRQQLQRKMLETQRLESLGVLAGGIAHDFNNILSAILGNASFALEMSPPGSPVESSLQDIKEASQRAADLCRQMLAYSGKGRFVVTRLDLGKLVEATVQMLRLSISKRCDLRFHLEKGLPAVEGDASQLQQVVMNVVINASEAIGEASGVISITTGAARLEGRDAALAELHDGNHVFLEVTDSGCGMTPEIQARIFDPFFTTKFTGRGLGLAAVLGIMRAHKGALQVYSEVGRGTTFRLWFPAMSHPAALPLANTEPQKDFRGRGAALVVDDEEQVRAVVGRILSAMGFEVVLAANGREACEVFRRDPTRFAVTLLDLTMPQVDGEQTLTELRRMREDARVILMSGFSKQEALARFPDKVLSFLQKPFLSETLRELVQAAIA